MEEKIMDTGFSEKFSDLCYNVGGKQALASLCDSASGAQGLKESGASVHDACRQYTQALAEAHPVGDPVPFHLFGRVLHLGGHSSAREYGLPLGDGEGSPFAAYENLSSFHIAVLNPSMLAQAACVSVDNVLRVLECAAENFFSHGHQELIKTTVGGLERVMPVACESGLLSLLERAQGIPFARGEAIFVIASDDPWMFSQFLLGVSLALKAVPKAQMVQDIPEIMLPAAAPSVSPRWNFPSLSAAFNAVSREVSGGITKASAWVDRKASVVATLLDTVSRGVSAKVREALPRKPQVLALMRPADCLDNF